MLKENQRKDLIIWEVHTDHNWGGCDMIEEN